MPGLARDDAGAEAAEQRLDERHDVSLAVGGGHVDGVAEITPAEVDVCALRTLRTWCPPAPPACKCRSAAC